MSADHILLVDEAAPGIRVLTLNRPDKCNALSTALLAAVAARCRAAAVDTSVRCVVIAAAGPAFCAGADIAEMRDGGPHAVGEPERQRQWVEQFPKPLIAAVEGPAFSGGNELAMLADIVVAGANARFGQPEVGIGGMPGDGGTQRLVRAVGKSLAMQMILTGKPIDAGTALHSGLVSECVQAGSALARAMEIAGEIAAGAPLAAMAATQYVLRAFDCGLSCGLALEQRTMLNVAHSKDRAEGLAAFLERCTPRFIGQ